MLSTYLNMIGISYLGSFHSPMIAPLFKIHLAQIHSGLIYYSHVTNEGKKMNYHLFLYADLFFGGLLNIDKNQNGDMTADEIVQSKPTIEQFITQNLSIKNEGKKVNHILMTLI